ncbi:hypothetical protein RJT34_04224 [Clitoria ternatea]|uniref:HVA22-like protein n=1 Tax=Clitoria ternatea TaxID=43366 RepID=A0AAN9Q5X0_CLITE
MASLWFFNLALKCLNHFAWPLIALGYPLCASVQAIESDAYRETRNLISYWILLTLIYLFEYAFMRLLQWFQFWPYIKLVIIIWLIVPDFGRASHVYNTLVRSYISINSQVVICRLNNWKKFFVKKDNFLLHAERYIKENGIEALEKLLASQNTTCKSDEGTNAIGAPDDKEMQQNTTSKPNAEGTIANRTTDIKGMQQTIGKKLQPEDNKIKDLEVIEKKEIPAEKQDIPVMPKPVPSQNTSSPSIESKGKTGKDTTGGELPQSSTHREVQKEWTCALCQVKTCSEKTLDEHLHGKKHRNAYEALKAKNLKIDQSKGELKQKNIINEPNSKAKKVEGTEKNSMKGIPKKPFGMNPFEVRCEVCNIYCPGQVAMIAHLKGKKHLDNIKNLS